MLIMALIVAISLPPLPEEPPRINYYGLLLVVGSLVAAVHLLRSKSRWVPLLMVSGFPLLAWYLANRVKLLQMILEPFLIEKVALYTLPLVFVYLMTPTVWRDFNERSSIKPSPTQKGFPF